MSINDSLSESSARWSLEDLPDESAGLRGSEREASLIYMFPKRAVNKLILDRVVRLIRDRTLRRVRALPHADLTWRDSFLSRDRESRRCCILDRAVRANVYVYIVTNRHNNADCVRLFCPRSRESI